MNGLRVMLIGAALMTGGSVFASAQPHWNGNDGNGRHDHHDRDRGRHQDRGYRGGDYGGYYGGNYGGYYGRSHNGYYGRYDRGYYDRDDDRGFYGRHDRGRHYGWRNREDRDDRYWRRDHDRD